MELREKVKEALTNYFKPDHVYLEDDDGISGYVVSSQFRNLPSLERQIIIDKALRSSSVKLTQAELRRVLAIAPLTPAEYEALGYKK